MQTTLLFLVFFSAPVWGIDTLPPPECALQKLHRTAGRDLPDPVKLENWSIEGDRLLIQQQKQVVDVGVRGEVGEVLQPHDGGFYVQVDTQPGGVPYRTVNSGPGPYDTRNEDVPLYAIVNAILANPSADGAPYIFLAGKNTGLDGQVKRVIGDQDITLKTRHWLEKPTPWNGSYSEGQIESTMTEGRTKRYATFQSRIERVPSLALQMAKQARKPVVAPLGELEYWYSPKERRLYVGVFRKTTMTAKMLPMEEAFIKAHPPDAEHPQGWIEPIKDPLAYIGAREGIEVVWDKENPKFRDGTLMRLDDPTKLPKLPSPKEVVERLYEFNVIDYETYLRRLNELGESED